MSIFGAYTEAQREALKKYLAERGVTTEEDAARAEAAARGEGFIDTGASAGCPENAIIFRRGLIVDVQNEDRFSPVNSFAFNPMAQEYMSIDNAVLALILLKLAKQSPQTLAKLMDRYMGNVTKILTEVLESSKAHPVAMLNAHTTFACVAHRFGIINDAHYLKIADQTRHIIDVLQQLAAAGVALGGLETLTDKTHIDLAGLAAQRKR